LGAERTYTVLNLVNREGAEQHFVLETKLTHGQSRVSRHTVVVEKPIPTFHFPGHFPADTIWWQCSNAAFISVLFEQIQNIQLHKCSSLLLADGCPKYSASSTEVTQLLTLENNIKTHVFCTVCLQKASFNILKVPLAVLLGLKQNIMQTHCSRTPKSQMEQHTFVFNKALFNYHTCHSLTPSRK
jgi:hypothetical protein